MNIKKLNLNGVNELDTDECGHVLTRDDLIQIKLWNYLGNCKQIMGTIDFYYRDRDFSYSGVLNKMNSDYLFNVWNNTEVSNFILRKKDNNLFCDIDYCFYHDNYPEQYRDYRRYVRKFPEQNYLEI